MNNLFPSVLVSPDSVMGATEKTPFRFEEEGKNECAVKYDYIVQNDCAKIIIYPSGSPIKYLKLRFSADLSFVDKVLGDQWERCGLNSYVEWRSVMANRVLPWYCVLKGGDVTACYGVKTGANCFAFWQVDTHGITLFLNLKSGEDGTDINEPLLACEVVQMVSENQDCYDVVNSFCAKMCDNPVMPKTPIFGVNNWYWAYGDITAKTVREEADCLSQLCKDTINKPYLIIDDGWQYSRNTLTTYNGGPWVANDKFVDMQKLAKDLDAKGVKGGLWFRPLLTQDKVLEECILSTNPNGVILDPTHPLTIEKVVNDVQNIRSWGYSLIKHDFTVMDIFGGMGLSAEKHSYSFCTGKRSFFDKTKTTATVAKELYQAIQNAFGDGEVIGCNAFGHLTAGIHSIQRVGCDNSGNSFEWTRRDGVNSMMRLPQNENFFMIDPDCAVFTNKVGVQANLDFLKMCAITGVTAFASIQPNLLTDKDLTAISDIFKIADTNKKRYTIKNYDKNANPERFLSCDGQELAFDWDRHFNGSRVVVDWEN